MKKFPVTFLMAFGHCGLDWLHSLLDSHRQILLFPALSFYRCWKMLGASLAKNEDEMFDMWQQYIVKYIGPDCKNEQKRFLHTHQEVKSFFLEFKKQLSSQGISRVGVFWALHLSWAYAKGIELDAIKAVVVHEHQPWPFEEILLDFKNANTLMIMRDPRASVAGIIKGRKIDFGYLPDFTFNMIFETWFQAVDMWIKHGKILGDRFKIVKNEELHDDLEANMRDIACWLQVDFDQSMLVSTYSSGKDYFPDSRYLDKANNSPVDYEDFYLPENIKKRWLGVLADKRDLLMIESLFNEIMGEFNYERITKRTFFSYLKGVIYFFLPNHALLKKWRGDYPNIEDLKRIENALGRRSKILCLIWKILPSAIKFLLLIIVSILRRLNIYFFSKNRWVRYDNHLPIQSGVNK